MIETLRVGVARGFIEFRHTLTNGQDLWGYFFPSFGLLITLFFMGDARVPGTSFSLGVGFFIVIERASSCGGSGWVSSSGISDEGILP